MLIQSKILFSSIWYLLWRIALVFHETIHSYASMIEFVSQDIKHSVTTNKENFKVFTLSSVSKVAWLKVTLSMQVNTQRRVLDNLLTTRVIVFCVKQRLFEHSGSYSQRS